MLPVSSWTSAKRIVAPCSAAPAAVATKVSGGTIDLVARAEFHGRVCGVQSRGAVADRDGCRGARDSRDQGALELA